MTSSIAKFLEEGGVCRSYRQVQLVCHRTLESHRFPESFTFANETELVRDDGRMLFRLCDGDGYEARLCKWLLGTPKESEQVSYPTTWWDAFKARWFPRWLRRFFPVAMTTVCMERYCVYPEVPRPQGIGKYLGIPVLLRDDRRWEDTGRDE